jgi:pimeloyl-ACP methyl ester carboxylesterase
MNLEYKGSNIYYTDNGKGNVVVLLHGFLENSNMWEPFIPTLSKNHRIICIDLLGHGKTECLGYVHTMELMADCVKAVIQNLNILKATFIGHSMGGYVALAFAEENPDMVEGLCLMNSTAEEDHLERKKNRDRAILAVKENHKLFVTIGIVNLFRPKNRTLFSEEIKQVTDEAIKTRVQGIIAALEGMKIRKNRAHILQTTKFKKMMIISEKDPVLEFDSLINQAKNTNVKIVKFPDGHMSHIENKSEFLIEIVHFIENI